MEIQLIRHATLVINLAGTKLLVDPVFAPTGSMPPIDNSPCPRPNPLTELSVDPAELCSADAVLLTHTHRDHFDSVAAELLPKDKLLFCQPADEAKLKELGFVNVRPIEDQGTWGKMRIIRVGGQHGTGEIGRNMGPVSGYVIEQPGEPSLYIAGDTIWCPDVERTLAQYRPAVTVLFAGAAQFLEGDPITMTDKDVMAVGTGAPFSNIVVVHMETFNHCLLTRAELAKRLEGSTIADRVVIPADGEVVRF